MAVMIPIVIVVTVVAVGGLVFHVSYLLWASHKLRAWAKEQGGQIVSMNDVQKDSRWFEPAFWWKCRLELEFPDGQIESIAVRYGGLPPRVIKVNQ